MGGSRQTDAWKAVARFAEQGFQNVTGLTAGHYVHSYSSRKGLVHSSQSNGVGRVLWARMTRGDVVVKASMSRYDVPDALGRMRQMNLAVSDPRYDVIGVAVELNLEHATVESLTSDLAMGRNYVQDFRSYVRVGKTGTEIAKELRGDWSEARHVARVVGFRRTTRLSLSRDLETDYSRLRLEMPIGLFGGPQRPAAKKLAQVTADALEKILSAKPTS
jgi:hypothetical protein